MSNFVPNKEHSRSALLFCFHLNKTAAEAHRMLVEAYGSRALSETTCRDWFRRFKNDDFGVEDKERPGQPKKFKDTELQALLDKDDTQSQEQIAEMLNVTQASISKRMKAMKTIQKCGKYRAQASARKRKEANFGNKIQK